MNNFKNTYIKLRESDKTVNRVQQIANKYSVSSKSKVERYILRLCYFHPCWSYIFIDSCNMVSLVNSVSSSYKEITEEDLDNYLEMDTIDHMRQEIKEALKSMVYSKG